MIRNIATAGAVIALLAFATPASADVVYSNNLAGDDFTNAGPSNTGQAIGASGWHYNNVRSNGHVGISAALPRSGSGSASFQLDGGANSKADVEFFASASANGNGNFGPTSSLGTLSSLTGLSYDWYRVSGGTANNWLHPVIRLQVVNPLNTSQFGYLVFERTYNDFAGAAPTDEWVSDDVFDGDYRLWSTGALPNTGVYYDDALKLSNWQTNFGHFLVTGVSLGVGSGWGSFNGAVDNVAFRFSNESGTTAYDFNFETSVIPVPAAALLALLGLGSAAVMKRRA